MLIYWSLITDCVFPKRLANPDILCELSSPVAEITGSELNCLVVVKVKCSYLGGPGCWSSQTTKGLSATWLC